MTRQTYSFTSEPTGDTYKRLLEYAVQECTQVILVRRQELDLSERGQELLRQLEPFLILRERANVWPGTELIGHTATVYKYALSEAVIATLTAFSFGLYSWVQPALPEDLCLLRQENEPWLVTISHENDGYLVLSDDERARLVTKCAAIGSMLKKDIAEEGSGAS